MSKRFGRNQKRKLNKELADVRLAHGMDRALMGHMRETISIQSEGLRTVARVLGENFFGLPPVTRLMQNGWDPRQEFRMPKIEQMNYSMRQISDREMPALVSHAVLRLEAVSATVDMDKLRNAVHVRLQTPDGPLAYNISAEAWQYAKTDVEHLTREITRLIARDFAHAIARSK